MQVIMARVTGQINCILNTMEKYNSFSLGNLRFIDSLNFMMSSLDALVKGNAPEDMKITEKLVCQETKRKLLLKKGIYLYNYMDSFD